MPCAKTHDTNDGPDARGFFRPDGTVDAAFPACRLSGALLASLDWHAYHHVLGYVRTRSVRFQVMSARNVAMTPPQCPTTEAGTGQPYFQKEFFHNGYIKSLKQLVHFYNTRDTSFAFPVTSGHCPAGTTEKVDCWPMKEVPNNLDTTTGMLGLTDTEENQIVAFLQTLTDGFTTPYPDRNTFTGSCMTCNPPTDPNCSPSRQSNNFLIPTPPLPPCASAICGVAPVPSPPIP